MSSRFLLLLSMGLWACSGPKVLDSVAGIPEDSQDGTDDTVLDTDETGDETGDEIEDCANGFDDDHDGATDCEDPDCAGTEDCPVTCWDQDLGTATGLSVASGSSLHQGDETLSSCDDPSLPAPDRAFLWQAPFGAAWRFSSAGSGFSVSLSLWDADCSGAELSCGAGVIERSVDKGERLLLVLDGQAGASGDYVLSILGADAVETACDDGDDDLDLLADCADPDCAADPRCIPEPICDDSLDDDLDGLTDCDDSDCAKDPHCLPESVCGDALDDDTDGLTDCDDSDCAKDPHCLPESVCDDTLDDDTDGLTDCDDSDCASSSHCLADCLGATDLGSALGEELSTGTTVGGGDDTEGSCGGSRAEELAFTWTAPATATYEVGTGGSSFDTVAYALEGTCDSLSELECDDDSGVGTTSLMLLSLEEGQTLVLVVDGYYSYSTGSYALSIVPDREVICDDSLDDDSDGLTDCEDDDCLAACSELDCRDGIDGDTDGLTDCEDDDCAADPTCIPESDCADSIDQDLDGLTDCDDPDCAAEFLCSESCFDGYLGAALGPAVAVGSTLGADDDRSPTCASALGAGDQTWIWIAPNTDTFTFSLEGSSYDTVLSVEEESCEGVELGCDDSSDDLSSVSLPMVAGDAVLLNVDGEGAEGDYVLNIWTSAEGDCENGIDDDGDDLVDCDDPECAAFTDCMETLCDDHLDDDGDGAIDCLDTDCSADANCSSVWADADLGSATSGSSTGTPVSSGSTVDESNTVSTSCGGSSSGDLIFLWVAPSTATWTFSLYGSDYDTLLGLFTLDGTELDCNDDEVGSTSELSAYLYAGQAVLIDVDGYRGDEGDYVLTIY